MTYINLLLRQMVGLSLMLVACSSDPQSSGAPGSSGGTGPGWGGNGTGDGGASGTSGSSGGHADGGAPASYGFNIDLSETSTSGLSSGAFMAVQFHVAFSSIMKGVGVFAGGPFFCAQGAIGNAFVHCMTPTTKPDVSPYVAITKQWSSAGSIDDMSHLGAQRVFLFGGADDHMVNPVVMDALADYYAQVGATAALVYENRHPGAAHTMPTEAYGTACDQSVPPYIGKCGYDGAGKVLAHIYGTLNPKSAAPGGSYIDVPQSTFLPDAASHSIADKGFAYVPASCAAKQKCRVHVVFHGCTQNAGGQTGDQYYKHTGYNEWADTNGIIVLYPQTIASAAKGNSNACWDWWGYDSADYAKKSGPQMKMVRDILDSFAGK